MIPVKDIGMDEFVKTGEEKDTYYGTQDWWWEKKKSAMKRQEISRSRKPRKRAFKETKLKNKNLKHLPSTFWNTD